MDSGGFPQAVVAFHRERAGHAESGIGAARRGKEEAAVWDVASRSPGASLSGVRIVSCSGDIGGEAKRGEKRDCELGYG